MKKIRWQLLIICLTGLAVGVLLLAEQPVQTFNPVATDEPVTGGSYTEALVGSFQRLNPVLDFYNPVDRDIDRLIYSGLLRFDGRGMPVPDLAENWGISKDGTIYNFSIRKNARWHDGTPVTADDVLFTIELLRSGGNIVPGDIQEFWKAVDALELDQYTLQFRLPEPFAPFMDYLTFGVLPKHKLGGKTIEELVNDPFNMAPIGSGPFKFNQLLVEDGEINGVVLVANPDYHFQPPYIQQIIFRYFPNDAAVFQAIERGEVQGWAGVTQDYIGKMLTNPNFQLFTGRIPEMTLVLINLNNPEKAFLKEIEVRKALQLGLNRQLMVDQLLRGQAVLADGPILPGTWAYNDGLEPTQYSPEAAREYLKQAGFVLTEGEPTRKKGDVALQLRLIYPDTEYHRKLAELIQKDWNALGVGVELEAVSYDLLVNDRLAQRDYQVALVELNFSRSPDPDPYPFWDQAMATGGQNYTQWDNRFASEYLEQARITTDIADRTRLYHNFQVLFRQEVPAITLFYPMYSYVVKNDVSGVSMGPLFQTSDRFVTITRWSLAIKKPIRPAVTETPDTP